MLAPLAAAAVLAVSASPAHASDAFAFVVIADPHVGRGAGDFGTPGYDDRAAPSPRDHRSLDGLETAIAKVRALKERHDIRFALILGDVTESAERSQYAEAKRLLETLPVPYFPILGNHDVWPYAKGDRAPRPFGDEYFEETFAPAFASLKAGFPDLVKEPGPVWNPEHRVASYFQNFAFSYGGYGFLGLDWVSREKAWFFLPGSHTEADLHDFPGGTYRWVKELLGSGWAKDKRRVFLFQHHPYRTPGVIPDWGFGFSHGEKNKLEALFGDEPYWGVFAGHFHRAFNGDAFKALEGLVGPGVPADIRETGGLRQVETAAAVHTSMATLIEIAADGKISVTHF